MVKAGVDHMPAQSLTHRYVIASNRRKVSRLVQLFEESGEKLKRALVLIGGQSRINDFVAALQERYASRAFLRKLLSYFFFFFSSSLLSFVGVSKLLRYTRS